MYCDVAWIHSRFDTMHLNLVFMNMDTVTALCFIIIGPCML